MGCFVGLFSGDVKYHLLNTSLTGLVPILAPALWGQVLQLILFSPPYSFLSVKWEKSIIIFYIELLFMGDLRIT